MPATVVPHPRSSPKSPAIIYLGLYLAIYFGFLALLSRFEHFAVGEPLLVFAIIGVAFSGLAWGLTRKSVALPFMVKQPAREAAALSVWLVVLAVYLTWGSRWVATVLPSEPLKSVVVLGIKLLLFVIIPILYFGVAWGYRLSDLLVWRGARRHLRTAVWMSLTLIAFQCIFGRGLDELRHSGIPTAILAVGVPLVYLFLLVEVGLVEEFFFRVLLQSRLSAWLGSEMGGIVLMSLLFGLLHAPGLHYRAAATQEAVGAHPSWLMAIGYSIVVTSVAGFFLGVLWARTRNLLLVMAVHAAGDLVPNFLPMLKNWI